MINDDADDAAWACALPKLLKFFLDFILVTLAYHDRKSLKP